MILQKLKKEEGIFKPLSFIDLTSFTALTMN